MTKELFIEGMSCGHCIAHVEEALKDIDGIESVHVNLEDKKAIIQLTHDIDNKILKEAIDEAGYELVNVE